MMSDNFILWNDVKKLHFNVDEIIAMELVVAIVGEIIVRNNELGWTQQEISDKTGITQANISRIFSFDSVPRIETIARLLNVFGLEIKVTRKGE